jgi:hypothetical protein
VSRVSLNDLALKIGLSELVEYDKKSMQNINVRNSIFGNGLEAFIGAIFLDKGFKKSKYFIIEKLLRLHIDVDKLQQTEKNFKGRLIEYTQKSGMNLDFKLDELAHGKQKIFKVSVIVNKKVFGEAEHTNKKQAEQQASEKALELLKNTPKDFFIQQEKIENREEEVLVDEEIEEITNETIYESNDNLINEDLEDSLSEETESEDLLAETEVNIEIDAESIHLNKVLDYQTEEVKTNN